MSARRLAARSVRSPLDVLSGLLGLETLDRKLNPRRRRFDERIAGETVRKKVAKALRQLANLGFVDAVNDTSLRLRPALMRFADPVREASDPHAALARLVQLGEIAGEEAESDVEDENEDDPNGTGER